MTGEDNCPRCGASADEVCLVDPTEDVWGLDAEEYDDEAEVWLCVSCNWSEEATLEESMDEAFANLEWAMQRMADVEATKQ